MGAVASDATSFLNGERIVVLFFVSRLLYSLPLSLLSHGLCLSLLALASFFLEIRFDSSNSLSLFCTRPGASSGILLGAVTLPAVILSKLIQLSRALPLGEVKLQEFQYLTLQYWATSASCLSVLIVLSLVSRLAPFSRSDWGVRFSLCLSLLQFVICFVFPMATSESGLLPLSKLSWIFFHGLAAVKLIQHFLSTFPSCASIGEALLVTSGIVLYFGDMLLHTIAKICGLLMSSELVTAEYGISRSEISIIIQGLVLGLLLFPIALKYILQILEWSTNTAFAEGRRYNDIGRSLIFFASLGLVMIAIIPSWMQLVHEFRMHPFVWYINICFSLIILFVVAVLLMLSVVI